MKGPQSAEVGVALEAPPVEKNPGPIEPHVEPGQSDDAVAGVAVVALPEEKKPGAMAPQTKAPQSVAVGLALVAPPVEK